ncbi:zinc-binding dehydrogenase [Nocardia otitidiscaviarum]|uniref:quinone oxidoreductase family protein n=1 Tax=Nocardia otitidiscaviarum TaxID=1823 RepID=UPI0004A7374B|nr:zinc-binding dehydrogenase [Nocardia otitidiscaviarum]MBF6136315.1 zinc-binding dehydrogenase [Nocardia otitidiscaviarum]MBF6484517.1 zinc-binding dehydrogenase [Nocardia otitidiscaviarum]
MRKFRFSGRPEAVEAQRPQPGPGQLLVRTQLIGVHLGLVRMLRAGDAAEPGGEMVGTVVDVGPDVPGTWLGKRVGGVVFEGVYAEYVLAVPALVTELPVDADAADALVVVRGGVVAMGAVRSGGRIAGQSVLVTGAASGSGHLAVQIARALGALRVVGAVGAVDKAAFVRACGADAVVTYDEPWDERFDVIVDGVGGSLVPRAAAALAPRGRLVAYSAGGGSVEVGSLLADLKTVTGFSIGLLARTQPDLIESYRSQLWKLLADGVIRPQHTVFAAERIDEAIAAVEARRNLGRVVLRMDTPE